MSRLRKLILSSLHTHVDVLKQAGIFDLQGVERSVASHLARAIVQGALRQASFEEAITKSIDNFEINAGTLQNVSDFIPDGVSLFGDPSRDKLFGDIEFRLLTELQGFLGAAFRSRSDLGAAGSDIRVNFADFVRYYMGKYTNKTEEGYKDLRGRFISIFSHELRHAADTIYNFAHKKNPGEAQGVPNPNLNTEEGRILYYNKLTERRSYAGDIAKELYFSYGESLRPENFWSVINNWGHLWERLYPQNRKPFLKMVYDEYQRLVERNYYEDQEDPPLKSFNPYKPLQKMTRDIYSAEDFAYIMTPGLLKLEYQMKMSSEEDQGRLKQQIVPLKRLWKQYVKAYVSLKYLGSAPDVELKALKGLPHEVPQGSVQDLERQLKREREGLARKLKDWRRSNR